MNFRNSDHPASYKIERIAMLTQSTEENNKMGQSKRG